MFNNFCSTCLPSLSVVFSFFYINFIILSIYKVRRKLEVEVTTTDFNCLKGWWLGKVVLFHRSFIMDWFHENWTLTYQHSRLLISLTLIPRALASQYCKLFSCSLGTSRLRVNCSAVCIFTWSPNIIQNDYDERLQNASNLYQKSQWGTLNMNLISFFYYDALFSF